MSKKILRVCRDTNVVWIFDEDAEEQYGEATLIYGVTHVRQVADGAYGVYNKDTILCLQFGVSEVKERW